MNTTPNSYVYKSFNIIAADALSRLDIVETDNPIKPNMLSLDVHFSLSKRYDLYPFNYKSII